MRFIHTADIHIGATRQMPGFFSRQEASLDFIFKTARERQVDAVVFAGDIWNQPYHPPKEKDLFLKKVLQNNRSGYEIIVIAGNHDILAPRLTHLHHLTLQTERNRLENVFVVDNKICFHKVQTVRGETFVFLLIPYGTFKYQEINKVIKDHIEQLENSSLQVDYDGIIGVSHFPVVGCNSDVYIHKGTKAFKLPKGVHLDVKGESFNKLTYMALGDLHAYQRVGPKCYYSGSPVQTRGGENLNKGILLVDTDDPDNPEFIPVPSKKIVTFYEPPQEWPTDVFIRYVTTGEVPDDLPPDAKIVWAKPELTEEAEEGAKVSFEEASLASLLDGLEEHLKGSWGCPEALVPKALEEAKDIAQELGLGTL